jgi:hypothetical protein
MSKFFSRSYPPVVKQPNRRTCWAAAAVSWVRATPKSPARWWCKTVDDVRRQFAAFCDRDGGLTVDGGGGVPRGFAIQLLAASLGMDLKVIKNRPDGSPSELTGRLLLDLLRRGHVWFLFADGAVGHCVVVWGVAVPDGADPLVMYMDPWQRSADWRIRPLSDFQRMTDVVLGWPEKVYQG